MIDSDIDSHLRVRKETAGQQGSVLFGELVKLFDFGNDETNNGSTEGGRKGEEPRVGGDLLVPGVWVLYRKPVSAQ